MTSTKLRTLSIILAICALVFLGIYLLYNGIDGIESRATESRVIENDAKDTNDAGNAVETTFESTDLFSQAFIDSFTINAYPNEEWLGIITNEGEAYILYHFNQKRDDKSIFNLNLKNVTDLYICNQHLDFVKGQVMGADYEVLEKQFRIGDDEDYIIPEGTTGEYFQGYIDVFKVDLSTLSNSLEFIEHIGSLDGPINTSWQFNVIVD